MTRPRTFAISAGCPFRGDDTFPGCAHWKRCVAATIPRGTWIVGYVPEIEAADALATCMDFKERTWPRNTSA